MINNPTRTPHPTLISLGRELRIARESRGITQQELGAEIHFSDSQISAVETGRRLPSDALIRRADEILGTAGLLVRLLETAQATATRETLPEWFRPWADIEQAATKLRSYQPLVLDGLLQTPAYAHAMFQAGDPAADEDTLQRAVAARIDRQQIFNRPNPPRLITILEESVLHRPIGPTPEVMRNQLDHLATASRGGTIEIHILRTEVGTHRGLAGAFALATIPGHPEIAYIDTQLRGLVIEATTDVDAIHHIWEGLLGEALPQRQSLKLIQEATESWTT
ncbi:MULTISPECIES: helix-turn-helix domain-containing protein [Catenuloplanes]|uniref:Transcriptional regulator with XRE-family HTH domain n=1 Tax=Catenuloplanes niger TaxID=587534 RepID=A0AAE3ZP18_9ACTN|nr:helix-turn-helix transcriptional regulator [Catenuloplanes niger]MDR7323449.1 transcriptional regulator with XRE-family HTH domain [Catenuloplanes niger]